MKLSGIIIFTAVALAVGSADAATKCVALGSSTTCTSSPAGNNADWSATCTTGSTSTPIQGIAFCSNQKGSAQYATSSTITTSSTATENLNCWCKMVSPAVSSWVFIISRTSADSCAGICSYYCAAGARSYSGFRSAMFSGLGD